MFESVVYCPLLKGGLGVRMLGLGILSSPASERSVGMRWWKRSRWRGEGRYMMYERRPCPSWEAVFTRGTWSR